MRRLTGGPGGFEGRASGGGRDLGDQEPVRGTHSHAPGPEEGAGGPTLAGEAWSESHTRIYVGVDVYAWLM